MYETALGPETARFVFWRLRITFRPREAPEPTDFQGSLVRGAFGKALRQVACTTGAPACTGCPEIPVCAYGYGFETPSPEGAGHLPHPFAMALDGAARIELALIGRGRFHLASFVEALRRLAPLDRVDDVTPRGPRAIMLAERPGFLAEPTDWGVAALARPVTSSVTVKTLAPLRLLEKGEPVTELDLARLLRALFRRVGALARFHCGFEPAVDYRALLEGAARVATVERRLVWRQLARYSHRQKRRMVLGGLEGSVTFAGELAPYLPWLALGEALQVGKGTSFGLGRYEIRT